MKLSMILPVLGLSVLMSACKTVNQDDCNNLNQETKQGYHYTSGHCSYSGDITSSDEKDGRTVIDFNYPEQPAVVEPQPQPQPQPVAEPQPVVERVSPNPPVVELPVAVIEVVSPNPPVVEIPDFSCANNPAEYCGPSIVDIVLDE